MAATVSENLNPKVVSPAEWLAARKEFLKKEKEFTRLRDELSRQRRELPWEKVEKPYFFEGAKGKLTLGDLFETHSQLIVYHFMFVPGWKEGCPGCSFLADTFDGARPHIAQRDAMLVAVSRASLAEIEVFRKRMGWRFPWVSSAGSDFNFDYGVSFAKDEVGRGAADYNYGSGSRPEEAPGLSVFYRNRQGEIFHTYSTYARGLETLLPTYSFLDLTPKGRNEALPNPMSWVRHHDRYSGEQLVEARKLIEVLAQEPEARPRETAGR